MSIKITDNSDEVKAAMQAAAIRALEKCGLTAEGYAKKLCPEDTGNLKNSITHAVDPGEKSVYIGTDVEYGLYQELGTGIYAESGGRPTPCEYQDAKGNWHRTHGNKAQPFIKPAVTNHGRTYKKIIESELKGE